MSEPEVRILDDIDAVSESVADEFVAAARAACEERGRFRVALSGGTTPCRLHRRLTEAPRRAQVDWPAARFFFGDERAVFDGHANSNCRMAWDTLLGPLEISERHVHRMQAERRDIDAAARLYEDRIADEFEVSRSDPPPAFDLVLLGMGGDGHTASLFPDTDALDETERWVVGNAVPRLSTSRMTFTFRLINAARRVVFMVTGADKADALAAVLDASQPRHRRPPAAGVDPTSGDLLFVIDRGAASRL